MPYPISINVPTPKELAEATQAARESTWGMRYPPKRPAPLPGWIRVKFYSHIYKIRHEMLPDMEGEVMLHPSGGLDTRRVCKLWSLENCAPIDPERWIPFDRPDPNWLSPLAVHILSERNKCLMFIEQTPVSPSTAHKREFREATLHLQASMYMFSHLSFSVTSTAISTSSDYAGQSMSVVKRGWTWLDERTKIPEWVEYPFLLLLSLLSFLAGKTKASSAGKYVQNKGVSYRKKFRKVAQSGDMMWFKENMHWIVSIFCLALMAAGMVLVFGTLSEWRGRYSAMIFLRQPSNWVRVGANGNLVGFEAESSMGF